jgi:hypothetical protein
VGHRPTREVVRPADLMCGKHIVKLGNARKWFAHCCGDAGLPFETGTDLPARIRDKTGALSACPPPRALADRGATPRDLRYPRTAANSGMGSFSQLGMFLRAASVSYVAEDQEDGKTKLIRMPVSSRWFEFSFFRREDKRTAALPILNSAVFDFPDTLKKFT